MLFYQTEKPPFSPKRTRFPGKTRKRSGSVAARYRWRAANKMFAESTERVFVPRPFSLFLCFLYRRKTLKRALSWLMFKRHRAFSRYFPSFSDIGFSRLPFYEKSTGSAARKLEQSTFFNQKEKHGKKRKKNIAKAKFSGKETGRNRVSTLFKMQFEYSSRAFGCFLRIKRDEPTDQGKDGRQVGKS